MLLHVAAPSPLISVFLAPFAVYLPPARISVPSQLPFFSTKEHIMGQWSHPDCRAPYGSTSVILRLRLQKRLNGLCNQNMTTDNPSSVPVQPSHYNSTGQSTQPFGDLDHLPGIDSAGPYSAMNYVNILPPTRYTSSMGYNNPSHLATGPGIAPGPPLEQYAPATPLTCRQASDEAEPIRVPESNRVWVVTTGD
ncbi:hypothetical protein DFH94DRAFT_844119 [Russula ochroleuca]|uniref:Uncharacterized protein n=1 Tax=Russula ochroleuca TaxID=152965 RepID=A0A9P5MY73_9AGAM|nr:hypothetical protein DFH94DRAFT_844119 [Russula ochroleuca]